MSRTSEWAVVFPGLEQAELREVEPNPEPLGPQEVAGPTRATVVSAGTELALYRGLLRSGSFPFRPGYAAVFEVAEVGAEVTTLRPGDLAFCSGGHRSWQRCAERGAFKVPEGLAPEVGPFARMMGVSMSTLVTTTARPPDLVLVTGLGLVGHLAAQVFAACGYRTVGVDPHPARRAAAEGKGLRTLPVVPVEDPEFAGRVSLVVECSGHEQAVLDGCKVVAQRGEVVLVGVPWRQQTELSAADLLYAVFHRYAVLRSGWEWEVPWEPTGFRTGSLAANYAAALDWLSEGRVRVEGLYEKASPEEADRVYAELAGGRAEPLAVVFDWGSRA